MTGTAALVALLRVTRRPGPWIAELAEAGQSLAALLEQELAEGDSGQRTLLADPADASAHLERAAADIEGWRHAGFELVTVLDPDYPTNLRAVHDRPALLFVAGRLLAGDRRALAVVGSRRASPAGRERAAQISRHLVGLGYTVLSGLAAGIDTAAHTATLAAGGRTVAVIGTGLGHSHPPENAGLQSELAVGSAVLSPFWPDTPPSRETFPRRNGVMSGLGLGTIIVEADARSGTRIQARLALAHGRRVFLHHSLRAQAWAQELAARPAVVMFSDPEEITATLDGLNPTSALTA